MKNVTLALLLFSTAVFAGYGGPMVIIDPATQTPAQVTGNHELKVIQSSPIPVIFPSPAPTLPVNVTNFPSPVPTQSVSVVNPQVAVTNTPSVVVASPIPSQTVTVSNFPSPVPTQSVSVVNQITNYAQESGGHLSSVDGKLTTTLNGLKVDGSGVTQPISAASLPLPSGAATSANQSSIITDLATINTTLGSPFQAGGSIGNTSFGISGTLPAFASTPTFNLGSLNGAATAANQSTQITSLSSIDSKTPALGQAAMSASQPVALASDQPAFPDKIITGSVSALNAAVTISVSGYNTVGIVYSGTFSANFTPEGSVDGTNWTTVPIFSSLTNPTSGSNTVVTNATSGTSYFARVSGFNAFRMRVSTYTSGTASVTLEASTGTQFTYGVVGARLMDSTGTQIFAGQHPGSGSIPVVIASDQSAVPISASSLPLPTGAATSAKQPALGTAGTASSDVITVQGISGMTALKTDGSGVTQPVSGTVTANAGTGTFTVAGTVTANAGTGTFTVDASGHTVPISAASLPLPSGAATAANQTAVQGSASGGTAAGSSVLSGAVYNSVAPSLTTGQQASLQLNSSGGLKVDGSAVTQPVSGTVTANAGSGTFAVSAASLPLPSGAATSANQTNGTQQTQIVQGGNTAIVTASSALKVDGSAVTQPVSGTVTANAGTGTFAVSAASLPLPSGAATSANQTTANTTLSTISGQLPAALDGSGFMKVHEQGTASVKVTPNTNGSYTSAAISGASTITAPANAVGVLLEADGSNSDCLRFEVGGTASSAAGFKLEAGRDTGYMPVDANISIAPCSGTQTYNAQWILSQ